MADTKIRILFSNFVDANNHNAQSLNARELALRLDPNVFEVTLFFQNEPDARLRGCNWIRLVKLPSRFGTPIMLGHALRQDIIFRANANLFTCMTLALAGLLRLRVQFVDWLENYPTLEMSAAQERYLQFIVRHVQEYVGITEGVAEAWNKKYGIQVSTVIPVGVDTKRFVPPPERKHVAPVVLFVGTLLERKNPHVILMAARCFPETKFVLVGATRGTFFRKLERLVKKWKLQNVVFATTMTQTELARQMQASDILMHPSKTEGCPKVVLEGAATGLPALILKHYKAPVVIDGVTGYQDANVLEMIEHLRGLLRAPALRMEMGARAADYAHEFDWDVITARWALVFRRIARGTG